MTVLLELREHLISLNAERAAAALHGLEADQAYMADLHDELESVRDAFTRAVVIAVARLREELSGAQVG